MRIHARTRARMHARTRAHAGEPFLPEAPTLPNNATVSQLESWWSKAYGDAPGHTTDQVRSNVPLNVPV